MAATDTVHVRIPYFRVANDIVDEYGPVVGAIGVAVYMVLARYADRTTGECWPKIRTIGRKIRIGETTVKRYLKKLRDVGLITIDPRYDAAGDRDANLYTLLDPSPAAVAQRLATQVHAVGADPNLPAGGGSADDPPSGQPDPTGGAPLVEQEQNPLNKTISTPVVQRPVSTRQQTCTHPIPTQHRFTDGIVICHHCFALLDDGNGGMNPPPPDTQAA